MSAKVYMVDSGNVSRFAKRICVVDSGNVTRVLKKIWAVDSGNVSRLVFSGADYLTLVAGTAGGASGYVTSAYGSLTPSVLGDGATVTEISAANASPHALIFTITGYAGTIVSSYLTSLAINTSVFLATAATFSGGSPSGSAQWEWSPGALMIASNTYSVTVQRSV